MWNMWQFSIKGESREKAETEQGKNKERTTKCGTFAR
jgi:hypothetical protein